jgi:2-oxo-4-hydroxy-4-carboxy-5-ureidoimidazoline decarboxylase
MTRLAPLPSALSDRAFVDAYGGVYESSPWVAEAVCARARTGALDDAGAMRAAMRDAVDGVGQAKQLTLVRAHPELADRAAMAGKLTGASDAEQKGAGLDQCSPGEFAEFMALNRRYNEKFGFPFIIAVKGHDRQSILNAFRRRIENDREAEFRTALTQVHQIAAMRLSAMAGE